MSVAIYTKNERQSQSWVKRLQQELPNVEVEVYPEIADYTTVDFLLCWKPYAGLVEKFTQLKVIQSLGAGVDHILETQKNIDPEIQICKIVDERLTVDMWEYILSIVMADLRNLSKYQRQKHDKIWKPKRYRRLCDQTIGLLGLGTIGSFVAHQFTNLGAEVLGWSNSPKNIDDVECFTGRAGLYDLCKRSDYIINLLPLTAQTKDLIDGHFFSQMKASAYFINVGRGGHVVSDELLASLNAKIIRGAALDVFRAEPLPADHPFWIHPDIFITPHIGSRTHIDSVYPQVVENIRRLAKGKDLLHRIDLQKGY